MKKFSQIFLFAALLTAFSVSAAASPDTTYESEKGQAVIGPPSSSSSAFSGNGLTVVIDPGHQGSWVDMSAQEPMAPGSSETKAKATTGTQGSYSGVPEYEVNLQVSLALEQELSERGYRVVMTRTDNDTAISNKERAELATREAADITVRIHANSDGSSSAAGALTMAPTSSNAYLDLF